jgi:hypothetical protein
MKGLLLIFGLLLAVFMTANAQESATYDYDLGYNDSYCMFSSTANATSATDSLWYYTVKKEAKMALTYDVTIQLDSTGGTNHRTVVTLQGKNWPIQSYTTIATKAWTLGHDTTINFTETSTVKQYRIWRTQVKSDTKGFIFKVLQLNHKFWEK